MERDYNLESIKSQLAHQTESDLVLMSESLWEANYAGDAISEFADSQVSIYTWDNIRYALEHMDSADEAADEFCIKQNDMMFSEYVERVGAAAEYMDTERQAYEDLAACQEYMLLQRIKDDGMETIDKQAYDNALHELTADVDNMWDEVMSAYRAYNHDAWALVISEIYPHLYDADLANEAVEESDTLDGALDYYADQLAQPNC